MSQFVFAEPQSRIAMPVRRNDRPFSAFGVAMQSPPPLRKRIISRLRFALVFVKTSACFAPEHLAVAQPKQDGGNLIAPPVGFLECVANIDGDIDADFIDESQWTHPHPPLHKGTVDFVRVHAAFEKFGSVEQIRKQNAVDEKTRT